EISKKQNPKGLEENKSIARKGGFVAKKARQEIEKQTGESIISSKNAKLLKIKNTKLVSDKNNQ
ncbi:phage antirepressor protein, partial [Candidatus Parcubacteria bacterium]|nr:phage antirepressor protein [Candidatus Parcubacteria bacterium]